MFFSNRVSQISFAARRRFRQHGFGIRIEKRSARIHDPGLQQHFRILDRRLPNQSVSVAFDPLDDMDAPTMKIASNLVHPTDVVYADGVNHQRISLPVADGLSVPGVVQVVRGGMLSPIGKDLAIGCLRGN